MKIPTANDYLTSSGSGTRRLQERLVSASFEQLRNVSGFDELSARVREFATSMRGAGYDFQLLDEDGESMLAHGGSLSEGARSLCRRVGTPAKDRRSRGPSEQATDTSF